MKEGYGIWLEGKTVDLTNNLEFAKEQVKNYAKKGQDSYVEIYPDNALVGMSGLFWDTETNDWVSRKLP